MDLELSDEQRWLSESVETLLTREWVGAEQAFTAGDDERARLWAALTEFGALEELGAVELCLIAHALGAHLASVPFLGSAALGYAARRGGRAGRARAARARRQLVARVARDGARRGPRERREGRRSSTPARAGSPCSPARRRPVLALVAPDASRSTPQTSLDATVPLSAVTLRRRARGGPRRLASSASRRSAGCSPRPSRSVPPSGCSTLARDYAAERRQFGRTIGSYQALRHLLADMYVRRVSSWSTVLYAAAALDDDLDGALQTASIAKAYVARAAREVAHGAFQVFGGIAFTEEHVAHRYLRRIVVRERQFGDAAHHERRLGRMLAASATAGAVR